MTSDIDSPIASPLIKQMLRKQAGRQAGRQAGKERMTAGGHCSGRWVNTKKESTWTCGGGGGAGGVDGVGRGGGGWEQARRAEELTGDTISVSAMTQQREMACARPHSAGANKTMAALPSS